MIDESKRVYVGNLPQEPDVCDSSVGTFINQAMHQSSLVDSSGFCVESVWLNPLKQFAFVQLRSDKAECSDIAEETIAKCEEEFGRIVCLMICRPQQQNVPRELVGQCLVQFEDVPSAIKAAQGLNHAKFDDRLVETSFADVAVMARLQGLLPPAARG